MKTEEKYLFLKLLSYENGRKICRYGCIGTFGSRN